MIDQSIFDSTRINYIYCDFEIYREKEKTKNNIENLWESLKKIMEQLANHR